MTPLQACPFVYELSKKNYIYIFLDFSNKFQSEENLKEHICQKECLPVETKKDWGILTPKKDEKSSKNPMSEDIESKSDELSSKNRISVIAFRKQPNKKNSVKLQPDVEKVSTTNSEAEVEIKTENPNEILVKVDTETKIEDKIEKVFKFYIFW